MSALQRTRHRPPPFSLGLAELRADLRSAAELKAASREIRKSPRGRALKLIRQHERKQSRDAGRLRVGRDVHFTDRGFRDDFGFPVAFGYMVRAGWDAQSLHEHVDAFICDWVDGDRTRANVLAAAGIDLREISRSPEQRDARKCAIAVVEAIVREQRSPKHFETRRRTVRLDWEEVPWAEHGVGEAFLKSPLFQEALVEEINALLAQPDGPQLHGGYRSVGRIGQAVERSVFHSIHAPAQGYPKPIYLITLQSEAPAGLDVTA